MQHDIHVKEVSPERGWERMGIRIPQFHLLYFGAPFISFFQFNCPVCLWTVFAFKMLGFGADL